MLSNDAKTYSLSRARLVSKEDFILLLARRERMVNQMAGCKKVLFAIRSGMGKEGVSMGINRFYALMRRNGMLLPKRKKYSCTTTKQDKSLVPSPNHVKDMVIDRPNRALCSDITYIYTEEGFLFLSLTMDMYVREIVGWAVCDSLKAEGPLEALKMASKAIAEAIWGYNHRRLHESLGYKTPVTFRAEWKDVA